MEKTVRSDSAADDAASSVSPTPADPAAAGVHPGDVPAADAPVPEAPAADASTGAGEPPQPHKSTGPRTAYGKRRSSQNALKDGRYAKNGRSYVESVWYSMVDLNEDPKEFERLLGDLIKSHRPRTPAEMLLVDDIASLRWQRRRNERAQTALLVRNLERMEARRAKLAVETEHQMGADALRGEVLEKGLLHVADCPTKFAELLRWLEMLDGMVTQGQFGKFSTALRAVYGKDPTLRGSLMEQLFEELAESRLDDPERADDSKLLRLAIAEEMRDVTEAYRLYLTEHVDVTRAMREECLAPVGVGKWRFLLRQEIGIDRQIERKTRLILLMQKADREAEESEWEHMKKLEELVTPSANEKR